ncbi:MAG: TatD family hydrolase [Candidatus Eremiobacteraeota bacterium]|nr:TatD family hydrolase [Candidatus Eremiobacteraeota bacterium]
MIDTHAHLHAEAFAQDRDAVVERLRSAGVRNVINVGCDVADSAAAIEIAKRYGMFASVGIHPHEATGAPDDLVSAFSPLLANAEAIAIGETGLDYYYNHSPRERQQNVLREHIRLARTRKLPVIFHHRDAFDDFTTILREEWDADMCGVVHCFTGNVHQARTFVEGFGLYLGIGGVLTFKTAQPLRDAVAAVGLGPLVLETDCPYLAPVPHRGKRNEPAFVAQTAAALAEVLKLTTEEIVTASSIAAQTVFGPRVLNP